MTTLSDSEMAQQPSSASDESRAGWLAQLDRGDRLAFGSIMLTLVLAALTIWREAETEPYHIDEYRQVRPYGEGLRALVDASFAQEQPPLDVLFGAGFQRVLGVGDVIQRGHSMVAGMVALGCLAALLWRSGMRLGVPVSVLSLALSPVFISFTAYARPYALPLALMLGFLLAVDAWLSRPAWWSAVAIVLTAIALPLSRVFEPPAVLVLTGITLVLARRRHREWGGRIWLPIGAGAVALVLVELPVYLRLSDRLTAYQGETGTSTGDQWSRLVDDSLPRLAEVFVSGWLAVVLVGLALALPSTRRRLFGMWWFWPLALTPLAFAVAFHLRTQPDQPFYDRYGYFWLPPFAVVIAVVTEWMVASIRSGVASRRVLGGVFLIVLLVFGGRLVRATADDLASTERVEFRQLAQEVERRLPIGTAVVFDPTGNPLGSFDTRSAPLARYTMPGRAVFMAEVFVWLPDRADGVGSYAIATNGEVLDVDGWTADVVTPAMTLYVSDEARAGARQLGSDLVEFGEAHSGTNGSMLRLSGASVLIHNGSIDEGCEAIRSLSTDDPAFAETIRSALRALDDGDFVDRCVAS